jgi:hypothetical protein
MARVSRKHVTPAAAQWLSIHQRASDMQEAAHYISRSGSCTFSFLNSADLQEEPQTWQKERYFSIA